MREFRPIELIKGIKPHENLDYSYSWESKICQFLADDSDSENINIRKVLPVNVFDDACFRETIAHLTTDIALEVEVKEPGTKDCVGNVKLVWLATVKKVCGYRVLMRWIGCDKEGDDKHDFWINFCTADLHRVGWGAENKGDAVSYVTPLVISDRRTDWNVFLAQSLTPMRTLARTFESMKRQVQKCKLQVGERVELLDNNVSTRVRPAIVLKTVGRRVCLQVKSVDYDVKKDPHKEDIAEERQFEGEFWCDQDSHYIFHIGWAARNGYKCYARDGYLKHCEQIARAIENDVEPEFAPNDVRPEIVFGFHKTIEPGTPHFEAGMKLEFLDPLDTNFNKLKVGTVVRLLKDGYLVVGADGDDMENESVPFHCTSGFIFPVGYAKKYGIKLIPPGGDENDEENFNWDVYLKQTRAISAPEALFQNVADKEKMMRDFPIGASFEASDLNESQLICPAHIVSIKGRLLEIGYDGWGAEYNQLFDYRAHDIFPLGWCEAHGYKLEMPKVSSRRVMVMASYGIKLKIDLKNVYIPDGASGVRTIASTKMENDSYLEIAQTETLFHNANPSFYQRISLQYRFDNFLRIRLDVVLVKDHLSEQIVGKLGEATFDVPVLLANKGRLTLPITSHAQVDIFLESTEFYGHAANFRFVGNHLHHPEVCPTIAPYFVFTLVLEKRSLLLHRSEVIQSRNPQWMNFVVPLYIMQFYQEGLLQLNVYNHFPNHDDLLIGSFSTTFIQIQRGPGYLNSYMLVNPEGKKKEEKMSVDLVHFEQTSCDSYFDLLNQGLNVHVGVAIDFTASNGDPTQPESLHFIHPHHPNSYTKIMLKTLPSIVGHARDNRITAIGFGAKIGHAHQMSNCFPLDSSQIDVFLRNPSEANFHVTGFDGLLNCYRRIRLEVMPFAPTEFADSIYHMSKFAKAATRLNMGLYFVLVVLTDGDVTNPKNTRDALIDACEAPISVVAVGIGNKDFSKIRALEAPNLKHSDGRPLTRQVLSFVQESDLSNDDSLALLPYRIQQWKLNVSSK
ncbi:unnamed protein product, partial [Mesorhabditis belari]|uniref:Copine C-terminal domain-containing protein n=1 Tax=Mesorhabditis belari TaxID=2138241 RepID=A0AAF3J947_9BILA